MKCQLIDVELLEEEVKYLKRSLKKRFKKDCSTLIEQNIISNFSENLLLRVSND